MYNMEYWYELTCDTRYWGILFGMSRARNTHVSFVFLRSSPYVRQRIARHADNKRDNQIRSILRNKHSHVPRVTFFFYLLKGGHGNEVEGAEKRLGQGDGDGSPEKKQKWAWRYVNVEKKALLVWDRRGGRLLRSILLKDVESLLVLPDEVRQTAEKLPAL